MQVKLLGEMKAYERHIFGKCYLVVACVELNMPVCEQVSLGHYAVYCSVVLCSLQHKLCGGWNVYVSEDETNCLWSIL